MSTPIKKRKLIDGDFRPSKLTETIKARVKTPLKTRADQYRRDNDCSESEMVRVALTELFARDDARKEQKAA